MIVVVLGDARSSGSRGLAVDIVLSDLRGLGQAEVSVDDFVIGTGSVLKVSILDILADLLVLEGPGAGGTAERISGIGENELLVELLAELDGVLAGVGELTTAR